MTLIVPDGKGFSIGRSISGVDESYNDFWVENAGIGAMQRTSHILYPRNGQLPALAPTAIIQRGNYGGEDTGESRPARVLAGGIGTDGPEDRGLSERCIVGFNAGPPSVFITLEPRERADGSQKFQVLVSSHHSLYGASDLTRA